jgi:hypothetical protein
MLAVTFAGRENGTAFCVRHGRRKARGRPGAGDQSIPDMPGVCPAHGGGRRGMVSQDFSALRPPSRRRAASARRPCEHLKV